MKYNTQEPCRYSLIEHPPESNVILNLMSEAADLLVGGRITEAAQKVTDADFSSVREWYHYVAQVPKPIHKAL